MKRFILLFAVLLFVSFSAHSALADSSKCASVLPGSIPLESGHRAYRILASLESKLGAEKRSMELCVWETGLIEGNSNVESVRLIDGSALIGATRYTLTEFSDAALIGAFAHELGHIMIGVSKLHPSAREKEFEEERVDAFAVKLVRPEMLRITYIEHTHDAGLADRRVARARKLARSIHETH